MQDHRYACASVKARCLATALAVDQQPPLRRTCSCTDCMLGHSAVLAVNSCGTTAGRPTATAEPITPLAKPSRMSRRAVSWASSRLGAAGRKARAALSSGVLVKLQRGRGRSCKQVWLLQVAARLKAGSPAGMCIKQAPGEASPH